MVPASADNPIDLFTAAQRLHMVRTACTRFLLLWAMSPAKDRKHTAVDEAYEDPESLLKAMSDPKNHDWSLLYRGSVLDD